MPDHDHDHDRRKRRRLAKSCEQCRQRKVRCDRTAPCGPCTRARGALSCSYRNATTATATSPSRVDVIPRTSRPNGPGNHPTPASNVDTEVGHGSSRAGSIQGHSSPAVSGQDSSSIGDIRARLQRVEKVLCRRGENSASEREGSMGETLRELSDRVRGLEEKLTACSSSGEKTQGAEKDGLCIDAVRPRLHASAGKMKVMGPSHYSNTMDKLPTAQVLHLKESDSAFQTLKTDLVARIKECRGVRHAVKTRQSFQPNEPVPDLQATIPARQICDELVDGYLRTFESIYRILHLPSFWREYHHFWAQGHHSPPSSTVFLMKLVLVLAIGTVFHPQRGKSGPDHDVHLTQTWIYAAQWWLIGPSEKATLGLDGIQVFCLLLLARQINCMGSSPWLSAGSLMQRAMAMGLHLDSGHFPALSVFQSEMRARLWATILEFSTQASMDSAVQPLLIPHFDTQPPANLNDADFDSDPHSPFSAPKARPTTEVTDTSIQRLIHQTFPLRAKIIQALTNRSTLSYTQTIHLGSQLQAACRSIAAFFASSLNTANKNPPESNTLSSTNRRLNLTPFHRAYLDMTLRRWLLALHVPFMLQSSDNPQFYFSRKICLDTAMTIASYAEPLKLPSPPDDGDDLSRLFIAGRSSLKGPLSLDIISILGLEVTRQIEESSIESPGTGVTDMSEFATSSRASILHALRQMLSQLLRVIGLGTPSLKRYNLLAAILGQIQAMETGACVKQVVYETVRESLGESVALLQSVSSRGLAPSEEGQGVESRSDQGPGMGGFDFDLEHPDLESDADFNLDIPSLLGLSDWIDLEMSMPPSHF